MIKYKTTFGGIEALEVERETDKQVIINLNGRLIRENKKTPWFCWHDTWDIAHAYLISNAQQKVETLSNQLRHAELELERIKKINKEK